LFDLNLRGKTVLLKPNLVEYIPGAEVNTNPRLVGAAASAFLVLGAKTVPSQVIDFTPGNSPDLGFFNKLLDSAARNSENLCPRLWVEDRDHKLGFGNFRSAPQRVTSAPARYLLLTVSLYRCIVVKNGSSETQSDLQYQ